MAWGARTGTELRHRSVPQRAPARMGILHMCSRTGQVAWNCQHQNNGFGICHHCSPVYWQPPGQDGWTEKGTEHLYSRTEVTGLLHSSSLQHNFYNLNKLSSLLTPSNQTACGRKRLKTSYFVMPKLLKGISTQGCRSPEEQTAASRTDTRSSHDSGGEPVPGSEQIQTELMTQRQSWQSHGRLSLKWSVPTLQTA